MSYYFKIRHGDGGFRLDCIDDDSVSGFFMRPGDIQAVIDLLEEAKAQISRPDMDKTRMPPDQVIAVLNEQIDRYKQENGDQAIELDAAHALLDRLGVQRHKFKMLTPVDLCEQIDDRPPPATYTLAQRIVIALATENTTLFRRILEAELEA